MKGIILAGGSGTRLYPLTQVISKQLLPVYDKPMIYYPLSILMLADIKDILIISTPNDLPRIKELLGGGESFGINLSYAEQEHPNGIAEALLIGEEFIGNEPCALILGDNVFYGNGMFNILKRARTNAEVGYATIFGYHVNDPERFGVIEFDESHKVVSVEEKPQHPKSSYAATGLYFYPCGVPNKVKTILPSVRGQLEITTLNQKYVDEGHMHVEIMGRGYTWMDAGTCNSLLNASQFVSMVQNNQQILIASPEQIAYRKGWTTLDQLVHSVMRYRNSTYGRFLLNIAEGRIIYG